MRLEIIDVWMSIASFPSKMICAYEMREVYVSRVEPLPLKKFISMFDTALSVPVHGAWNWPFPVRMA